VATTAASPPTFASVLPKPRVARQGSGLFTLEPSAAVVVKGGAPARSVAEQFAGLLRAATGYALPVVAGRGSPQAGGVVLALEPGLRALGPEGYRLRIDRAGVTLSAHRPAGLVYGAQTLRQLLPVGIESQTVVTGPWRIRTGTIEDRPRFAWRGAMLDVARHFFGVADVKRFVDLMALYKLNRLHLHLSDDQGWRLAIRSWPKLAQHGGSTQVGGGRGGYYTQRQYADIVAYAAARYVTVVPEVDMPGHTNAALASYAKLNCDGVAPALYTGIEVGFSSLCIRKELTYRFADDVIGEIAALTPGPYLHIGGDEAQATAPDDYVYFLGRVQAIVRAHGKRMVGWEETARAGLHRTSIAQHWHDPELARRAVGQGARVIMSPAAKTYLDMKYATSTKLGLTWAGLTSVRDAYSWDPATQVTGVRERDIMGVEAPLWAETTQTVADQDFLAFPRLLGHAEIAWSPAHGRAWRDYRWRLAAQGVRLDALGVGFYRSPEVPWR
jgi:hexosaminidase